MSTYKTGLVITGDASGGIKAVRATDSELHRLNRGFDRTGRGSKRFAKDLKQGNSELQAFTTVAKAAAASLGGLLAAGSVGSLFASAIKESEQLQRNLLRTEQLIQSTGRTGQTTADQLRSQAQELARATLGSTEDIMQAQQILMTFKNVGVDAFDEVTERALDLASVTGVNVTSAMNQIAKALEQPVQGINAMTGSGVSFSQAQKDLIKDLVETGRQAEAQRIILDELAGQYGGVARKESEGLAGAQDGLAQSVQEAKLALAEKMGLLQSAESFYKSADAAVVSLTGNMDTFLNVAQMLAIAVGGKLAGALSVVIAAKIAAQAESMRYQATLARMAGVSATAAASQTALAAAVTTANRAMMLMGGPVGVALIAAGSLYTFRHELGLVRPTASASADSLSRVDEAMTTLNQTVINNTLDELQKDLQIVTVRAQQARVSVQQLQTQITAMQSVPAGDVADGSNMGDAHVQRWGRAARELNASLAQAQEQLAAEQKLLDQLEESIEKISERSSGRRDSVTNDLSSAVSNSEAQKLARQMQGAESYLQELARMRATDIQQIENWKQDSLVKLRDYHRQGLISLQQFKDGESMIIAEANQRLIDIENKRWDRFLDGSLNSLAKLQAEAEKLDGPRGEIVRRGVARDIASQTFSGLSDGTFVDPSVGGPSSEIDRLQREREQILAAYDQRIEDYRSFRELEVENKALYDDQIAELEERRRQVEENAERSIQRLKLQQASETFGALSGLARVFAGEQSGIYKTMFALQKAYTIGSVLLSSSDAIAKAWSSAPFPQNIPAVATTVAETGVLQQMVASAAPSFDGGGWTGDGPRSGGVDGKGGFWAIMHPREYVTDTTKSSSASKNITKPSVTITVPIQVQAQSGVSEQQARMQGRIMADQIELQILNVMQEQMRPGGMLNQG